MSLFARATPILTGCLHACQAFADICAGIESHFNQPGEDRRNCEGRVGADLQPQCTYVAAPVGGADVVGASCPQDLMTASCAAARTAGDCLRCIELHTDLRSCDDDEVSSFCDGGVDPCAGVDCGGNAEGHCAANTDADQAACDAIVQSPTRTWDVDQAADATACNAVGFAQFGRTGAQCQYFPGATKGQCEILDRMSPDPQCHCLGHWKTTWGDTGGRCTERCTPSDLDYPGPCFHNLPPDLDPDAVGGTLLILGLCIFFLSPR